MQSDVIFNIVQVLIILGLGTAWYNEFIKRRKAEADAQVAKDRVRLNEIQQKLDALPEMQPINPIPPHILEYVTQPSERAVTPNQDGSGAGGSDGGSTGDGA